VFRFGWLQIFKNRKYISFKRLAVDDDEKRFDIKIFAINNVVDDGDDGS
jgi:hypothetical protein